MKLIGGSLKLADRPKGTRPTLLEPEVLSVIAWNPEATLSLPVVSASRAVWPMAALPSPVVREGIT